MDNEKPALRNVSLISVSGELFPKTNYEIAAKQELKIPFPEQAFEQASTLFQKLTSYDLPSFNAEEFRDGAEVKGFNDHLPESINPLILEDRVEALATINSLLSAINGIKEAFIQEQKDTPICPYEQTLLEYLGPSFTPPSIDHIPYPLDFSTEKSTEAITHIDKKYYDLMSSHVQDMIAEAADTSFPGITSENIGNAFAVLSATSEGNRYVIDRHKAALHLEFAELIRNLPIKKIIGDPIVTAHKIISRYIEINYDVDLNGEFPYPQVISSTPQPVFVPVKSTTEHKDPHTLPSSQQMEFDFWADVKAKCTKTF